ncbi:sensor histidine kinase [Paenibacillus turpanensis]|uniref:sensor histidine kinase n=1 Tax=Paenibacillus turpanensis TaxID=2689078 RepID=UPI00140762D2|nr:sensor histidine kinase [Paenibacillus turpanensis]
MWNKILQWNTLRNQILFGFVAVMMVVLLSVGVVTFSSVSNLLKDKAEKQMRQTAVQANGRLEALLNQIETLTTQAVNDSYLQQLLLSIANGNPESFNQRQALLQLANNIQAYSHGVSSVELFTSDFRRLFPLDEQRLTDRLEREWIDVADREKGRLVWIGIDPKDPDSVLAIRRINLVDRWFNNGGYLLVRLNPSYFNLQSPLASSADHPEMMLLVDRDSNPILTGDGHAYHLDELLHAESQTVTLGEQQYVVVRQASERTGWTLMILYPVSAITDGITVLRSAVLASGGLGMLLSFILTFLLSTMITRPILRLMRAMRNTRQGVLTPNPHPSFTAELNDLNTTYNQMVDHMNGLIKQVYEEEVLRSRSEMQALQAQINPHFLYNTLEALYWSLQVRDQEELAELVIAMSELFRYVISRPGKEEEWVALGKELEHIERYLRIMSVRFGKRLSWSIHAPDEYRMIGIPKLLIQPLVENAILHGVEGKMGGGTIEIRIEPVTEEGAGNCLRVRVRDNGPGMTPEKLQALQACLEHKSAAESAKGTGMGITNVHRRVQLSYPSLAEQASGLRIESRAGEGTMVSFHIAVTEEDTYAGDRKNDSNRG